MPDKYEWLRMWISKNVTSCVPSCGEISDLLTDRDQLAQAIRECIEQTGVGLGSGDDLPDALRQIAQVLLLQRGNLELLERKYGVAECERKLNYGAITSAVRVLSEAFLTLTHSNVPSEDSIGGQLAQCVESVLGEIRDLKQDRDRLRAELAIYKPTESTENGGTK